MEDKAKRYAKLKHRLAIIDIVYLLFLLAVLQFSGANIKLKGMIDGIVSAEPVGVALYAITLFVFYIILNFFLDLYRSFIVEHKFELSKQKISFWILDYLKGNVLGAIFFVILMEAFFFFVRNYTNAWWWMSAIFWIILSIVIARIFPVVIIPLFFKYKKIDNENLRKAIFDLAQKMQVKILDVFEIDFSKKSLKANAAFVGLGRSKRVLLADTLMGGKFLQEEIEMILAHEFAHYGFRHLLKMVVVNALAVLLTFFIFFILSGMGIEAGNIANLGTWLFLFTLLQLIEAPFMNWMSRIMERNADGRAIKILGKPKVFISMMEKLAEQNLAERNPPTWVKIFFYDHPTIDERIQFAKNMEA